MNAREEIVMGPSFLMANFVRMGGHIPARKTKMKKLLLFMHLLSKSRKSNFLLMCLIDEVSVFIGNRYFAYLVTDLGVLSLNQFKVRSHMKIEFPNLGTTVISHLMDSEPDDPNQSFSKAWFDRIESITGTPINGMLWDSKGEDSVFYGWDGQTWIMSGWSAQRPFDSLHRRMHNGRA